MFDSPALPQRRRHGLPAPDPLAAHAQRRDRRGHLRQGAAGHDDGAGAARAICPACWCPAASRCCRKRARTRARCNPSARASPTDRSPWKQAAEALCRACALARRRLPVPGHRGHVAGGRRGAGHVAAALGAGALGPADLARHGAPLGARACWRWKRAGCAMRDILTRRLGAQRHGGARGLRRLDQPAAAHPGHRLVGGTAAAHGGRLDARQPPGAAPGGCAAQRPEGPSHGAGLPGRRRAGGDAAPAARGAARDRRPDRQRRDARRESSTGGSNPSAAPSCGACCASATASIPTT